MTWEVRQGDCVEQMAAMEAGSVDAVVCDPPYGLEFMGKDWDRLGPGGRPVGMEIALDAPDDIRPERRPWKNERTGYGAPKKNARCKRCGKTKFNHPGSRCNCKQPDWDTRTAEAARAMQEWHQAWATEALRVLKPGGHLLAFGGTRTYHRMTSGIEDAGFEIRDTISWMYGSGFPKSLDVSKAIDRANGKHERDLAPFGQYVRAARERKGWTLRQLDEAMGTNTAASWWEGRKSGVQPPGVAMYQRLKTVLALDDRYDALVEWAEAEREKVGDGKSGTTAIWADGGMGEFDITAPATPEAERWQGWGTALKPAHEPVVVARKPLSGTVVSTVLEHGTGALNVDATRVAGAVQASAGHRTGWEEDDYEQGTGREYTQAGRWPPNVLLSHSGGCVRVGTRRVKGSAPASGPTLSATESVAHGEYSGERAGVPSYQDEEVDAWSCEPSCPVRLLDEQTGESVSRSGGITTNALGQMNDDAWVARDLPRTGHDDSGGASRFFPTFEDDTRFRYVAKAGRAERNAGLDGFEEQLVQSGMGGDMPTDDQGRERDRFKTAARNVHPTVKPIELMRWLVRLVTPPGGTVLDPFTGSGSTGCAAMLEGFDFIGIEREPEYADIAEARIGWWLKHRGDGLAAAVLAAGEARDAVEATGQLELDW